MSKDLSSENNSYIIWHSLFDSYVFDHPDYNFIILNESYSESIKMLKSMGLPYVNR